MLVLAPTARAASETFVRANLRGLPFAVIAYFGDERPLTAPWRLAHGSAEARARRAEVVASQSARLPKTFGRYQKKKGRYALAWQRNCMSAAERCTVPGVHPVLPFHRSLAANASATMALMSPGQ